MYTLGLGILLCLLKYLEVGPVATWSWWWVLSPFAITLEKMDQRKQDRIDRNKEAMGMGPRRPR